MWKKVLPTYQPIILRCLWKHDGFFFCLITQTIVLQTRARRHKVGKGYMTTQHPSVSRCIQTTLTGTQLVALVNKNMEIWLSWIQHTKWHWFETSCYIMGNVSWKNIRLYNHRTYFRLDLHLSHNFAEVRNLSCACANNQNLFC